MPLLGFLNLVLPWFSKAFFANSNQGSLLKKMEGLVYNLTGTPGEDGYKTLLQDPEMLLNFQKQALNIQQEYVKHICQDRIHARKRDMLFMKKGGNHRADRMIYIACFGLFSCVVILWICRQALSVELVSIISAIIGVFGSCLKDAYVFEFGSGKLNIINKTTQKQLDEFIEGDNT